MDREYKEIKEKLIENKNKKVLILGTIGIDFKSLKYQIKLGKLYEQELDDLFITKYGYINMNQNDAKTIEKLIKVKTGEPLFSNRIIPCD